MSRENFYFNDQLKQCQKLIPEFYESILEAAERGELWGITSEHSQLTQLELDLVPYVNNHWFKLSKIDVQQHPTRRKCLFLV